MHAITCALMTVGAAITQVCVSIGETGSAFEISTLVNYFVVACLDGPKSARACSLYASHSYYQEGQ